MTTRIILFILFLMTPLKAELFNHKNFTLKNGLQVYVIQNNLAPIVNVSLIYKVGTADDPRGQHGLSHFLEHMMFKGTKAVPKGDLDKLILKQGGIYNAHTNADYTCYTTDIVKDQLELILFLEADRMHNLSFTKEDVESERQVVLEERAMRLDNHPFGKGQEIYLRALFWKHPYGIPPIGYPEHINAYTYESAMEHYKSHYTPNNAILIVTGDVTLEEVQRLASKYFDSIPSRPVPKRIRLQEPSHEGTTLYIDHKAPRIKLTAIHISYFAPSYTGKDRQHAIPGNVLAQIVAGNELSRLYKLFVEQERIASSITASYDLESIDPQSFTFSMTLNQDIDPDKATDRLVQEINALIEKGITNEELDLAKRDMLADLAFLKDGVSPSVDMFSSIAYGIPAEDIENWDKKIATIKKEEVEAAAKFILKTSPAVVLTVYPENYKKPETKVLNKEPPSYKAFLKQLEDGISSFMDAVFSFTKNAFVK